MEKEFIPHQESVELKELGFNEPCFGYRDGVNYLMIKSMPHCVISAPTFSQAFRWFREKHGLKSWIEEHTENSYIYEIRPHKLADYKEGEIYVYATYEETELACLKKLIKIVKNKYVMEKEFVPYEQSLALKELGFNEPCFGRYDGKGENKGKVWYEMPNQGQETIPVGDVLAPTFSRAFKWVREKYKLHSTITSISQESWQWHIQKPGQQLGKLYDEDFYTYEEAELACLKKLIEIVKK